MSIHQYSLLKRECVRLNLFSLFIAGVFLLMGCSKVEQRPSEAWTGMLKFEAYTNFTAFTNMRPFRALVIETVSLDPKKEDERMAGARLRTDDGFSFFVGGAHLSPEQSTFFRSLKTGSNYIFPQIYFDWERARSAVRLSIVAEGKSVNGP